MRVYMCTYNGCHSSYNIIIDITAYRIVENFGGKTLVDLVNEMPFANILPSQIIDSLR